MTFTEWSVDEVCQWLEEKGLGEFQEKFVDNEIDGRTLELMTERMSERLFPSMRKQALFLEAREQLIHGPIHVHEKARERSSPVHAQQQQITSEVPRMLGTLPSFPPLLKAALQNQDRQLKSPHKTKMKSTLIQVLFDHLNQFTLYPSHKQYVEVLSSLLTQFPFLREKTGSGYDALHESVKNKFKKERIPLVNNEEVNAMKAKFKVDGSGRKRKGTEEELVMLKRTSRPPIIDEDLGEDERCIASHVTAMASETEKVRPNLALLKDLMLKTRAYHRKFINEHTTMEVLQEFPALKIPKLLLWDMSLMYRIDPDQMVVTNLTKMAERIIEMAPKSKLLEKCVAGISLHVFAGDSVQKGLQLTAAIILLPTLFREEENQLFVMEKIPDVPTPCISLHDCGEGNPLQARRICVHMDNVHIFNDDASVDLAFALGAVFSLYFVFGVEYPRGLKKTMTFLERFIFKMNEDGPMPLTIRRIYNSICD